MEYMARRFKKCAIFTYTVCRLAFIDILGYVEYFSYFPFHGISYIKIRLCLRLDVHCR